jgi:hypothetical protein
MPAKTQTYVRHIGITPDKNKDIDSLVDQLILEETDTGATVKAIASCMDEAGFVLYTLLFERAVIK